MFDIMKLYGLSECFFPMCAKQGMEKQEALILDDNYVFERKLDGSRYTVVEGKFFSRHPSEDKKYPKLIGWPVERTNQLPHLSYFFEDYPGTWFDGEIIRIDKDSRSDDVVSILGCDAPNAIARQKETGYLGYMVFDMLAEEYRMLTGAEWYKRRLALEGWFDKNKVAIHDFIAEFGLALALSEVAVGTDAKRKMVQMAKDLGWEGVMAKNVDSTYRPGKRPEHVWYKLKKGIEADVVVMGFTEGKGKFKGYIGSVEFGQYMDGRGLVNCGSCSGMNDELRALMTANQNFYIGKVAKITAMERTKDNKFRHPQWNSLRLDKTAKECVWGEC